MESNVQHAAKPDPVDAVIVAYHKLLAALPAVSQDAALQAAVQLVMNTKP